MRKCLVLIFFLFNCMIVSAQDPAFSQFYACPLYLNPALAGNVECGRASCNYRRQWPQFGAFDTYSVTYDQSLPQIKSGFGVQMLAFLPGEVIRNYYVNVFYAYQLRLAEDIYLRAGVSGGMKIDDVAVENILLPDGTTGTSEGMVDSIAISPDFSGGLYLSFFDKFYGGLSVAHFSNTVDDLAIKYTVHGGAEFPLDNNGYYAISPNFLYQHQGNFNQVNVGVYALLRWITLGVWYKGNLRGGGADTHVICPLVGLEWRNFSLGYSYDVNISGVGLQSQGAHEISLAWNFCIYVEKQKRVLKAIKSPRF
ncbi:MAG: PorP/SprF family type IX secretion system membrane protein [Bacteroidales bacterium]|nr:PorP/SprF family type IX secretion system membrane protein [Bacteroidales bacterium]